MTLDLRAPSFQGPCTMEPRTSAVAAAPLRRLLQRWLRWCILSRQPRLRLGAPVRPQSPLELMLCELFRCQREWSEKALVAQLARARAGSERQGGTFPPVPDALDQPLGRAAARQVLEQWVAQGVLIPATER
jgi:hypothetical protein